MSAQTKNVLKVKNPSEINTVALKSAGVPIGGLTVFWGGSDPLRGELGKIASAGCTCHVCC